MKVSVGSAVAIGLIDKQIDVLPTTCYIMTGDRCSNNCAFCAQAASSKADASMLSRVEWPEFDDDLAYDKILEAYAEGKIWRVCIQATGGSNENFSQNFQGSKQSIGTFDRVLEIVHNLQVPICISINANQEQVDKLIEEGVERVTISLDAATKKIFKKTKQGDFEKILDFLDYNAKKYPGKIGTHLIVGLGEKEKEMVNMIKWMCDRNITVGLFAFTPIKGTKMEKEKAPDLSVYRRIQAEHFKIKNKTDEISGKAFQTPGCEGCNRPYYNESVSGPIYNYPKKLDDDEFKKCVEEMKR